MGPPEGDPGTAVGAAEQGAPAGAPLTPPAALPPPQGCPRTPSPDLLDIPEKGRSWAPLCCSTSVSKSNLSLSTPATSSCMAPAPARGTPSPASQRSTVTAPSLGPSSAQKPPFLLLLPPPPQRRANPAQAGARRPPFRGRSRPHLLSICSRDCLVPQPSCGELSPRPQPLAARDCLGADICFFSARICAQSSWPAAPDPQWGPLGPTMGANPSPRGLTPHPGLSAQQRAPNQS